MEPAIASESMAFLQVIEFLINITSGLVSWVIGIVSYVLLGLSLYTIAKRRNIKNPWLAWIPVGNIWILGSVSDQYQRCVKGKETARRKWLLGLLIAFGGATVLMLTISLINIVFMGVPAVLGVSRDLIAVISILMLLGIGLLVLPLLVMTIVSAVIQFMCLFDLYRSSKPDSAVLFLILSILLGNLYVIFVFLCRKSDEGMSLPQNLIEEIE